MFAVERAVEIAEHNGWVADDGTVVVWDSLSHPYGTLLEVYPSASAVGGYCATMRDRVGRAFCIGSFDTKVAAAKAAIEGYLRIVNHGV